MSPRDIHVWLFDTSTEKPTWDRLLSPTEAATAQRLADPYRIRFKNRRAALRLLLGRHLQQAPTSIQYSVGDNGKLYLAKSRLSFNVARSENMAMIALGFDCEIGVDIEKVRAVPDIADIATHLFTESERQALKNFPLEMRNRAFLSMWTRKEAVLKADGIGIGNGAPVPVPGFGPISGLETAQIGGTDQCFYLYDVDAGPDFIASLALSKAGRVITQIMDDWQ